MTPTREQFKDFIAAIQKALAKEKNVNKALKQIWDDDQGQYPPFYISPLWEAVYQAFNIMFGLKDDDVVGNELSWWLDATPRTRPSIGLTRRNTTSAMSMPSMTIWWEC